MNVLTFPGYGVGSIPKTIVASRIVMFEMINYNGNHGTRIYLDTGAEVCVGVWPEDVAQKLRELDAKEES